MKLNHLDLQVPDVRAAVEFFERYFDFELCSNRNSPAIAILSDRHGFTLVLQRTKDAQASYPEEFHIGFHIDDEDEVRQHHARFVADGINPMTDVIENNRGVMFYCRGPGSVAIEVGCMRRGRVAPADPGRPGDSMRSA
ncbi:VOC family protein [Polyangium sp. 6x1]|uniref:VOC family protein n=1 Tax=Polyangium sp. 6x1 TaxID=3042689 RepID=UPI0024823834|nr:VOC family protein [Polyangium sp. 6x1]MDI1444335.1 VOC family protein [Polyangium sp. 6x1]